VVVAVEFSRLLRHALLVAAVAGAGWLLSAVFAGAASADELPDDGTQADRSSELLGKLVDEVSDVVDGTDGATDMVGGVADRVVNFTESLIDTSGDVPPSFPEQSQDPIAEPSSVLPGSVSGSTSTDRTDTPPRVETVVAPVVVLAAPPVAPAPVVPPEPPAPVKPPVVAVPAAPAAPPAAEDTATDHAGRGETDPEPAKTPSAPAGSGTSVSNAHDNASGARDTHGMLLTQAILHPADAGFTTRSLAVDGAGRVTGLPASSPD
jgi:hypothetical protein